MLSEETEEAFRAHTRARKAFEASAQAQTIAEGMHGLDMSLLLAYIATSANLVTYLVEEIRALHGDAQ